MIVQYVNRQKIHRIEQWKTLLDEILPAAFTNCAAARIFTEGQTQSLVTVTFIGPRKMRQLNRETRQVDSKTDILSFPMLEFQQGSLKRDLAVYDFDPAFMPRKVVPLGDLVLSLDSAFAQAEEYGHTQQREVAFLAVHGLLHLLGFDHEQPKDERVMRQMQREILKHILK